MNPLTDLPQILIVELRDTGLGRQEGGDQVGRRAGGGAQVGRKEN